MKINISKINSAGIVYEAKKAGLSTAELLGVLEHPEHPGSGDWMIRVYDVGGFRVADTNGNPVWEEDDPATFAFLLEEYNYSLNKGLA